MPNYFVNLRAIEPDDLEILFQWENDPAVWHLSNTLTPFSRFILEKYLEDSHLDIYQTKQLRLIIEASQNAHGEGKVPVGTLDLFDFEPFHSRAGVGILIADNEFRGKGIGSLAIEQLLTYAFSTLCLHQIYCNISAENKVSIELFKKHGFTVVGTKREWLRRDEYQWVDELTLQLLNPHRPF